MKPLVTYVVACLIMLVAAHFLTGCAYVTYSAVGPDGITTNASLMEFGRVEAMKGFSATTNKDGRTVTLDSASSNVNVDAITATTGSMGNIVGAALKAYTGKP